MLLRKSDLVETENITIVEKYGNLQCLYEQLQGQHNLLKIKANKALDVANLNYLLFVEYLKHYTEILSKLKVSQSADQRSFAYQLEE
jgi:hypothetical protein